MPTPRLSYEQAVEFDRLHKKHKGNINLIADELGLRGAMARARRQHAEQILGVKYPRKHGGLYDNFIGRNLPAYQNVTVNNKKQFRILIGSDKHNLPGDTPQAFRAFLHVAEAIKPEYIVIAGDWFDFPSISRHHRIGWQSLPTVAEELESGVNCLQEIKKASPKSKRIFLLGNHDMRFDGKIANIMPELEGIKGAHLADYLPGWEMGLSAVFNDQLIVKHRWNSGVHSAYNDTLRGGLSTASGHDHKLLVRAYTDYTGTRYGIKTGTLSDLWDESFMYMENGCGDWQPGFAVIEVDDTLITPLTCPIVIDEKHRRFGMARLDGAWYG